MAWATAVAGGVGHPGRVDARPYVRLPCSSTVEVTAAPSSVRLGPELAFQLHQAPDPGAVGAQVGLDLGGRRIDGGQVDAEQLHAPRQRRRDRPAQVWVDLREMRRSAYGQRLVYQSLAVGFVVGLAAQISGYLLRPPPPMEPLGLVADLLYALGWALWTGVVVVLFVQIIPENGGSSSGGSMTTRQRGARRPEPEATRRRRTTKRRRRGSGQAEQPPGCCDTARSSRHGPGSASRFARRVSRCLSL
jgi:hypothetical protein